MKVCDHCKNYYKPKNEAVQRFCCNSCRVMAHRIRILKTLHQLRGKTSKYNPSGEKKNWEDIKDKIG